MVCKLSFSLELYDYLTVKVVDFWVHPSSNLLFGVSCVSWFIIRARQEHPPRLGEIDDNKSEKENARGGIFGVDGFAPAEHGEISKRRRRRSVRCHADHCSSTVVATVRSSGWVCG